MKVLLDTCVFLWATLSPERLSSQQSAAITNTQNAIFLSVISEWEISIKFSIGKLNLPAEPDLWLPHVRQQSGVELLILNEQAAVNVHRLPPIHRDPFDRMLVSQAIHEDMVLATSDKRLLSYPVTTL